MLQKNFVKIMRLKHQIGLLEDRKQAVNNRLSAIDFLSKAQRSYSWSEIKKLFKIKIQINPVKEYDKTTTKNNEILL